MLSCLLLCNFRCPETSVTTSQHCVTSQKIEDLGVVENLHFDVGIYFIFWRSVDRAYICVIRTNKMHIFLLIYFNNHPLHVSSRLTIHHQELFYCICSIWNSDRASESQRKWMINTVRCIYSKIPPDDKVSLFVTCEGWLLKKLRGKVHLFGAYFTIILTLFIVSFFLWFLYWYAWGWPKCKPKHVAYM
jgi:hypothetical protein